MNKLYRFLIVVIFLASASLTRAQTAGNLTGLVKDEKGEALGYTTVAVLQAADAKIITGGVTEADGKFSIKTPGAGKYFIRLSAIGFSQTDTPPFDVDGPAFSKDFGSLVLKADAKALKEVSVQALRPTITVQADKMVVSVEGSALTAGNTAFDVLAKSPGVFVDQDGNIQLNGKAGVRIMIDGKQTYLSGKELQTMLQGMSAENLKDLELITNPSSKYDAEGTAGIININLKKNTITGFNGSVYAGHSYNGLHGFATGGNINYKKGKWNSFANLDVARRVNRRVNTMYREFNSEFGNIIFDQSGREEGIRFIPSLRLGSDYDLNKNHSIGFMANMMHLSADNDFRTNSFKKNGIPAQDSLFTAINLIEGQFYNTTLNGHYQGKLDSLGTTLTADLDFVVLRDQRNSEFYNYLKRTSEPGLGTLYLPISDNTPQFNIYSAKVDFTRPFSKTTKMEAGAKTSYVVSDSDIKFYDDSYGTAIPDLRRTNHFVYKENIYAAYTNFSTSFGSKWSVQGGLRAEQTVSKGSITRKYLNLFPSVFVSQKVSKDYQVTYNYSRRINRPRYDALNPFIFFLDKFTSAEGNPYLRPQYTNSFQVTQTIRSSYNLTLNYSQTKDFMAEIPVQNNETSTTVFSQRNVDDLIEKGATLVAPVKISKQWDMNNNLTLAHQDYSINIEGENFRNQQLFFYAQSANNIQLPKSYRMELTGTYQGPSAYGLYKIAGNWALDMGVKKTFLNNKLDVSVNGTDLFKTRRVIGKANYFGNRNEFDQYFGQRSVRVNLRYRFSKGKQFEAKRRNNSLDELNRAGGN